MSELQGAQWYVVHTYSGHENKVKATIEKAVKTRGMEDIITQVIVPTEDVVEKTPTGKEKVRQRKVYPSYVLIKMIITDESWYVVRNTKGVTGFVGPGSKPVPLSEGEVASMGIELPTNNVVSGDVDLEPGDVVKIINGSFAGNVGTVEEVNAEKKEVKLLTEMFGRKSPITIGIKSIERI